MKCSTTSELATKGSSALVASLEVGNETQVVERTFGSEGRRDGINSKPFKSDEWSAPVPDGVSKSPYYRSDIFIESRPVPAEIVSLAKAGGSFAVKWLPGFLARRWFSEERLEKRVKITLRDSKPISLGGSPNQLNIYLRISNFSAVDIDIDRIIVEVWFGQPSAIMANLRPIHLPAHSEVTDARVSSVLSDDIAHRAGLATREQTAPLIHIYVCAVCKTSFKEFTLDERIERDGSSVSFALSRFSEPAS